MNQVCKWESVMYRFSFFLEVNFLEDSWIIDNLNNAFTIWNEKLAEMWLLLTESPETFKGGTIWSTIVEIHGGMQAIGYGLLVLFFAISIFKSTVSFREFQRPEYVLKHFLYFVMAKLAITYGMEVMTGIFEVAGSVIATAAGGAPNGTV